jgi:hypothetical protein
MDTSFESGPSIDQSIDSILEFLLNGHGNLKADFNLVASVQALVDILASAPREFGAQLLVQMAKRLGDDQFPVLIKMLCTVGQSQDAPAKRLLCNALSHCIRNGDVPSGALTSWGIPAVWSAAAEYGLSAAGSLVPKRHLDPLSYLVTWFSQTTNRNALHESIYTRLLTDFLGLFDNSPVSAQLYQALVSHNLALLPPGTFQQATQHRLGRILSEWEAGQPFDQIAQSSLQVQAQSIDMLMGR